jgi:sugar lactone lactonase YvrE
MKNFAYYILALSSPVWAQAPTINTSPTREFGQPQLSPTLYTAAPNYVEGRELYAPGSVALDTVSSPHVLYVADMANNRVLAWQNPESLATCGTGNPKCGFASLVIGQRDLFSTLPQGPASSGSQLSSGLSFPTAVAVDSSGNLYVADVGNNRVLRFPQPFKQQAATQPGTLFTVDLVIGQTSATSGGSPNQGLSTPNAGTLFLSTSSSRLRTGQQSRFGFSQEQPHGKQRPGRAGHDGARTVRIHDGQRPDGLPAELHMPNRGFAV